jgi:hypothetical protein
METVILRDMKLAANHQKDFSVLFGETENFDKIDNLPENFSTSWFHREDYFHGYSIAQFQCDSWLEVADIIYQLMYPLQLENSVSVLGLANSYRITGETCYDVVKEIQAMYHAEKGLV